MAQQRVAVLTEPGHLEVQSREVPEPGDGEVRVRVRAVSVCGSDVHYYDHGRIGDFVMAAPLVLGHETSGVVDAVGADVAGDAAGRSSTSTTAPAVGTRVAIEPQRECGVCEQCRRGRYHLCPRMAFFATPPVDGSFAEHVVVPAVRAHPVPDTLSDDAAAMIEPLAVAVHAAGKARIGPDSRVLVSGAGPVGLLCLQVARARGAAHVTVTDVVAHRREVAAAFGADAVVDPGGDAVPAPVDAVLECTGVQAAVDVALAATAPAARVVLIGMGGDLTLPMGIVQPRELVLEGVFRYAHVYPAAIALAASGRVRLDDMVTSHHGLDDAVDALLAARRDPRAIKAVVRP